MTEWSDDAGATYASHAHPFPEVRVVVEGSMTIICGAAEHELRAGDRFDVDPDTEHSAVVGPDGVTYLAGRRP